MPLTLLASPIDAESLWAAPGDYGSLWEGLGLKEPLGKVSRAACIADAWERSVTDFRYNLP